MALVLVVLAMLVILVGIDAGFRLDERRAKAPPDANPITSEKIVVDLSDRDRD